jgi:hypothetical protein
MGQIFFGTVIFVLWLCAACKVSGCQTRRRLPQCATMTYTKGYEIAELYIRNYVAQSPRLSGYQFGKVFMQSENASFWTFLAGSAELMDEGIVPGAVYACVDKQTGRVWAKDEVIRFYEADAGARRTQPDSVAV